MTLNHGEAFQLYPIPPRFWSPGARYNPRMLRLSVRASGLLVGSLCLLVATGCAPSTATPWGDVPGMVKHRGMSYAHAWGRRSVSRGYGSDASDASLAVLAELGTD